MEHSDEVTQKNSAEGESRLEWTPPVITKIEVGNHTSGGKYLNVIIPENAWYHS